MKKILIQIILWDILFLLLGDCFYAQNLSDSLFKKTVIFKRQAYGNIVDSTMNEYFNELGYPQATGFFIKPDSAGQLYIATARHVIMRSDKVKGISLYFTSHTDQEELLTILKFDDLRNVGLYANDSLVDLVLVNDCSRPEVEEHLPKISAFRPNEIMSKEEFLSVKPSQELFYIGMFPDSVESEDNIYWFPTGYLKDIPKTSQVVVDTSKHLKFSYDFVMRIDGKPGVSGSPVFVKVGNSYKIFGIVNGFFNDSLQLNQTKNFIGTAGFRILEILKAHSLLRQ
jgi:hypothetical protein